jgi:tetratricopeptide (TPR) repeat protein
MQRPHYRQIAMPPLSADQAELLLRQQCGDDPSLTILKRNIIERAQGNPFFLEELVKAIADRGDFEGARGAYRLKGRVDAIPLPPTVQAVIAARIDRLDDMAKQVLETASVIGRVVSLSVLQRVTAIPHGELSDAIWQLRKADLLYDFPPFDQGLLAFRHPLIQEVAYATQLRSRLMRSHAAVAKAIEQFDWGKLDEFAGLLAFHYEAAGQTLDAITHLERAARWIGRTNSAEGLKSWKKVRALLQDQPRSEQNDRRRVFASNQILSFGWREGMSADEAKPYAEESLEHAPNEPFLLAQYGRILAASGAADDYVRVIQDALKLTPSVGDVGRFATFQAVLSQALFMAGRLNEALEAGAVALLAIAEQGGFESSVILGGLNANQLVGFDVEHWMKCFRTRILVRLGRFDEARERLADVLQNPPENAAPVVQFIAYQSFVEMAWGMGDPDMARRHAAKVAELAEQSAMPYLRVRAMACAGLAKATAGEFEAGARDLRTAIDFGRGAKAGIEYEGRMLADFADVLHRAGDLDTALEVAKEADAVARRRTDRVAECHAALVQGTILADAGGSDDAEAQRQLARADQLLRISGAAFFEPQLSRLRLRLAQNG